MTPITSTLAALVLTYNEEDNIKDCLESVKWIDEIVVIDSFSKDNTVEICKKYTNKIFQRKFDDFSSQRNYGLEKIESEWVLVVDADERVTPELREEIINELTNQPQFNGYRIPRKNYFLGKWIKYCGWYPDYTLRLFRKSNVAKYYGKVHEGIKIKGNITNLTNDLIHNTYRNLAHYEHKMNQYTTLWAEEKYKEGKRKGFLYIIIRTLLEFIKKFFIKKGFLLGPQGFVLSFLSSYYQFLKYAKLWEKYQEKDRSK